MTDDIRTYCLTIVTVYDLLVAEKRLCDLTVKMLYLRKYCFDILQNGISGENIAAIDASEDFIFINYN